jgi:hypothetical protein
LISPIALLAIGHFGWEATSLLLLGSNQRRKFIEVEGKGEIREESDELVEDKFQTGAKQRYKSHNTFPFKIQ